MNFTVLVVDHGNKLRKIIFQSRTTFKVENFGLAMLRLTHIICTTFLSVHNYFFLILVPRIEF